MAKSVTRRKNKQLVIQNLSEKDRDILTLEVPAIMKKYNVGKQSVYDRRFALNKKLRAAGLDVKDVLKNAITGVAPLVGQAEVPRKQGAKKVQEVKADRAVPELKISNKPQLKEDKASTTVLKPFELKFENFSIRLTGMPKKISVNPETNAIEIDL